MTDVEFERMLCIKVDDICLRDLIFNHYENRHGWSAESINIMTKYFTDELFAKMVHRKA